MARKDEAGPRRKTRNTADKTKKARRGAGKKKDREEIVADHADTPEAGVDIAVTYAGKSLEERID